jgi:AcrR family transcriptional regulator
MKRERRRKKTSKYESRKIVSERIVESTLELLLKKRPDELSLREIADHAKCHHPIIVTYFGGKAGLFGVVFRSAAQDLMSRGLPKSFVKVSPELKRLVQLSVWLGQYSPGFFGKSGNRPIAAMLGAEIEERYGLSKPYATLASQRFVALLTALVLSPVVLDVTPAQLRQHFALELQFLEMLAARSK